MTPSQGRVDCHVHFHPPAFADLLLQFQGATSRNVPIRGFVASKPGWRDLGALQRVMDDTGVELGVIIPTASVLDGLRPAGAGATEKYNRSMSDELAKAEGRFLASALVDPFGGQEEIAQLDRSLALPHLGAVGLVASYDGVALDDPAFVPIFEVARQHDVPVLVHPSTVSPGWKQALRLDSNFLEAGLGFLLDDALTILRMVINGTFDRFPDVRFMFCQLGGFAPSCCARWDYHRKQQREMSAASGRPLPAWTAHALEEYLGRIWLDTHSQDGHILRLVMQLISDRVIVLGGDYPITPPEDGVLHIMRELEAIGASPAATRNVERDNALRLLRSDALG